MIILCYNWSVEAILLWLTLLYGKLYINSKYHLILVKIGNIDSTDISLDTLLQGYNF